MDSCPSEDRLSLNQKLSQVSLQPSCIADEELDGFCSQDLFCTPDFLTPVEQQFQLDFDGNKENVCSISSPSKCNPIRSKRPRADFVALQQATAFPKDAIICTQEDRYSVSVDESNDAGIGPQSHANINYIPLNPKARIVNMRQRALSPPCIKNPFRLQANNNPDAVCRDGLPSRKVQFLPPLGASCSSRYREEFHEIKEIGHGNFSTVFKVLKRIDGCFYAVKRLHRLLQEDKERRQALTEVQALAAVGPHENIVRYHTAWFESDHLYIQMELCEGTLCNHMLASSGSKERILIEVLHQIARALAFLHSKEVVHLDVKPENIYYVGGTFKLGDFGRATKLDGSVNIEEGDARYMPLELMNDDYRHLAKSDIFALGASLYELARGIPLPSSGPQFQAIRQGRLTLLPGFSSPFQNMVKLLMHPNPAMRPTAQDLLKHPILCGLKLGHT